MFQSAGAPVALPMMSPPGPETLAPPSQARGSNGMCVASMVLGILGIIPYLGLLLSLLALILGIAGVSQAKKRRDPGVGMGIAGIVLGTVFLLFWVFLLFALIEFFNEI